MPMTNKTIHQVNHKNRKYANYMGFVNDLFLKRPVTVAKRDLPTLINYPTAYYVFVSGLTEGNEDNKDNYLYYSKGNYNIHVVNKNPQTPNIISAYKLAHTCKYMIENKEYDTISIDYIGVDRREDETHEKLVCEGAQHASLFKVNPDELYINWSAGLQIQFHPHNVDQSWEGNLEEWAHAYLRHFVASAQRRCDSMREKFIEPFLKYV